MRPLVASLVGLTVVFTPAHLAHAQKPGPTRIVSEMTPALVAEAIALGEKGELPREDMEFLVGEKGCFFDGGIVTTPFTRVAGLAKQARATYKTLDPASIPQEALAPELHVYAGAQYKGPNAADVETIVITPRKGSPDEKFARAIKPPRLIEVPTEYRNILGARFEGKAMMAVFPLNAWTEDNEVHIVYSRTLICAADSGHFDVCRDCKGKITVKKMR